MEDVRHFTMDCARYGAKRAGLLERVRLILTSAACDLTAQAFDDMDSQDQCEVILGKRIGDPIAEDRIDSAVKRYLTKAWNLRAEVTANINAVLGTAYDLQTCALTAKAS